MLLVAFPLARITVSIGMLLNSIAIEEPFDELAGALVSIGVDDLTNAFKVTMQAKHARLDLALDETIL
jgi:predicted component of type VI protein secretion system